MAHILTESRKQKCKWSNSSEIIQALFRASSSRMRGWDDDAHQVAISKSSTLPAGAAKRT
jgi:hypothetical protein